MAFVGRSVVLATSPAACRHTNADADKDQANQQRHAGAGQDGRHCRTTSRPDLSLRVKRGACRAAGSQDPEQASEHAWQTLVEATASRSRLRSPTTVAKAMVVRRSSGMRPASEGGSALRGRCSSMAGQVRDLPWSQRLLARLRIVNGEPPNGFAPQSPQHAQRVHAPARFRRSEASRRPAGGSVSRSGPL